MAHRALVIALSLIAAAAPAGATTQDPVSADAAPVAGPGAEYCMRVEPVTGSRVEKVECWTREEWAEQGVNVDEEWAEEGVRVIGA